MILNFDTENLSEPTMKKLYKYTSKNNFKSVNILKISQTAGILCSWVLAVEEHHKALKIWHTQLAKKEASEIQIIQSEPHLKDFGA